MENLNCWTKRIALLLMFFGGVFDNYVSAQVAIKNNLLYDATTTPNLGIEVGVARRSSVQLVYGLNPWKFQSETNGTRMVAEGVDCSYSLSSFNDQSNVLTVNLYNEDLKFQKAYTLNLTIDPTGVENVNNVTEKTVVSRVNLAGQQVKTARGITITKYSDGTTETRIK